MGSRTVSLWERDGEFDTLRLKNMWLDTQAPQVCRYVLEALVIALPDAEICYGSEEAKEWAAPILKGVEELAKKLA